MIIASPAQRAIETARLFAEAWHYPVENITTHKAIYDGAEASGDIFLSIVRALQPSTHTAMIVGHDPLLSTFAHFLNQDFTDRLPTCGVVYFAFDVQSWAEVTQNSGALRFFHSPKHEASWHKLCEDEIASKLTDQLHQTLATWHPDVATMMHESLRKTGTKAARRFVKTLQTVQAAKQKPSR